MKKDSSDLTKDTTQPTVAPAEVAPQQPPTQPGGQPLPPSYQNPANVAQPYREAPGQTYGIIGIVLNALGIAPGGIILGIMSRNKSKAAGFSTTLGTVSMVWGIVSTVFGVMLLLFYIGMFVLAIMTNDSSSKQTPPQNDWGSNSTESHI